MTDSDSGEYRICKLNESKIETKINKISELDEGGTAKDSYTHNN